MISPIVERLVKHLKRKKPIEWSTAHLEDFYFDICTIYYYAEEKEDKEMLRKVFDRVVQTMAEKKHAYSINMKKLDELDKSPLNFK